MTVSEILLPTCRLTTLSNWPSSFTINLGANVHTAQISIQHSYKLSEQCFSSEFFLISRTSPAHPPLHPPQTGLILQYHTTYCRIRSTARYKKHFQILYSEFWSIMKLSVKKYNNLFWHLSVVTVGEYWRFLWSTAVCHVQQVTINVNYMG